MNLDSARSFLFVPANRPERITKALASGADAVIVDLEDAVAAEAKESARDTLHAWLDSAEAQCVHPPVLVRVNGHSTPWHHADLALCRHAHVTAVMLPKTEYAEALTSAHRDSSKPVLPIIESALALHHLHAIAHAPGCARLVFGKLDLAIDLGLQASAADRDEAMFAPYRALLVLASRLAGLPAPVEGVFTALDDSASLSAYTQRARRDGFGALLLIHPRQVEAVHQALAPGEAELAWARRVLAAATTSHGAATAVDGQMIDAPVIARAERLLGAKVSAPGRPARTGA
ncbi:MAG: HpcH/HpaI aldolase/citrate lyase family protein [bacterium]